MFAFLKHLKIGYKLTLALSIPILIAAGFFINLGFNDYDEWTANTKVQELMELSIDSAILIDNLQLEQSYSNAYLGSEGKSFKGKLNSQIDKTNDAIKLFKTAISHIEPELFDANLMGYIDGAIKDLKKLKQKSVGIDITKARLANFSEAFVNSYNLEIEDLYNNKTPSGTKVVLQIPTNKL